MTQPTDATTPSTAHSDETTCAVHATIDIAVPPESVFEALTDPDELALWWGTDGVAANSHRTHDWKIDARPGGPWSAKTTDPRGDEGTIHGEIIAIDPPRLIEYSWRASWEDQRPTVVRFELFPAIVDGVAGTRVSVTHTGSGVTAHARRWQASGLRQTLTALASHAMSMDRLWYYGSSVHHPDAAGVHGRARLLVHA